MYTGIFCTRTLGPAPKYFVEPNAYEKTDGYCGAGNNKKKQCT